MGNFMKLKRGARNSVRIYKRDMKIIFTSYVTLIIIIGLIVLPCLYAWFNIQACWDPYSNTKSLSVAVVNKDKGSEYQDIKVNAGKDIENKLKENNKIGWKFVGESEASSGVKKGKYFVIKNLCSFSSGICNLLNIC